MKKINLFSVVGVLIMALFLSGCEEQEGEPLTVQEVLQISGVGVNRFTAEVNNQDFFTIDATATLNGTQLMITATLGNASMIINTRSLAVGAFLGSADRFKNYVNYQDANGNLHVSTISTQISDANIKITNVDEVNNTVSGRFSATVFDANGNSVTIRDGRFDEVPIVLPFRGRMDADIGSLTYESDSCLFTSTTNSGITLETFTAISENDTSIISITVEEAIQEVTYDFATDPVTAQYNADQFSTNIFKNQYSSTSGSLTIVNIDLAGERVQGIFNFEAENFLGEKVTISNGTFNALMK